MTDVDVTVVAAPLKSEPRRGMLGRPLQGLVRRLDGHVKVIVPARYRAQLPANAGDASSSSTAGSANVYLLESPWGGQRTTERPVIAVTPVVRLSPRCVGHRALVAPVSGDWWVEVVHATRRLGQSRDERLDLWRRIDQAAADGRLMTARHSDHAMPVVRIDDVRRVTAEEAPTRPA